MPTAPSTTYTQRPPTTRDDWTPARIRAARRAAELGQLYTAAQLVEYTLTDDRVQGILGTRVRGLLKSPIRFEDDEAEGETPITQALEADFWAAYPETDIANLAYWGLLLGVGIGEHRWTTTEDGRIIPTLHVWHPQWLHWNFTDDAWHLDTEQGRIVIEEDDPKWILYTPFGRDAPWRNGLYRSIAPWWLLKRYAILDWGGYSEAHGNPVRVGTTEEGTSKAYREELAQDMQNMSGQTGVGLPPGVDVKLLEATARTWETFKAQIDAANTAMAITITGQNLTTEVEGGSLAAARVHDVIRHDLIESDEQTLSTTLHQGPFRWWTAYNFGADRPVPWVRWDTTPPKDIPTIEEHIVRAGAVSINDLRRSKGLDPWEGDQYDEPIPREEAVPAAFARRFASGDPLAAAPGAVRGQGYLDRLVTRSQPLEPMRRTIAGVMALMERASSIEEVVAGLPELVEDIDDAGPMIEALIMASAAGAASEQDDHEGEGEA